MLELALDRAPQNRTYDTFGKLHVRTSNIAKACVSPYRGSEIPNHSALGLDPEKVYQLFRSPEELEKAAESFNNIPVLQRHVPVTPDAPSQEEVVGSTGTDCAWAAPFLTNSLVIWVGGAIAGIESEEEHEISPGYAYVADMTPGIHEGLHYDGIMRNIVANHLALVSQGRQGPDVVVGDAKPDLETSTMAKAALTSRKALLVYGGMTSVLLPLLAQDAAVDVSPLLADVTAANFKAKKPAILSGLKKLAAGKLAQDANLDSVVDLLDRLEDVSDGSPDEADAIAQPAVDEGEGGEDPLAKVLAFCKGKMGEDDFNELSKLASVGATDEEDGDPDAPAAPDGGAPKPGDGQAMDADTITARIKAELKAAAVARDVVEPVVGKVSLALDSAEAVYDFALDHLGIKADGANVAGKRLLIEQHTARTTKPQLAHDAAGSGDAAADFREHFPTASRLKR